MDDEHLSDIGTEIPVIAIGASAGGLEPLEEFFAAIEDAPNAAFVVVQHLSPDYRSMMDELLSRKSDLKIIRIEDGMKIERDTVYLNQPSEFVELIGDTFRILRYEASDALPHLPIDRFFLSLLRRDLTQTIAIILSGSGSDGAQGARVLHDAGAAVLVQSSKEAAFPSMPRAVLMNGSADRVLSAADMPKAVQEILIYGKQGQGGPKEVHKSEYAGILRLLEERHNVDFSNYKPSNVGRRITRRMHLRGQKDLDEYREILSQSPDVADELFHDMLIGVTEFYRDTDAIKSLRTNVLDKLAAEFDAVAPIKIWVPACASGEEVYTIAIELSEALRLAGSTRGFRIIGTDVHVGAIETASRGLYSADKLAKVDPDLLERYFQPYQDGYLIDPTLRQRIIFSTHNLISDPPFMNLDLVSCRNLMIYLEEEPQATAISMFIFGLLSEGYLFLGASETVGRFRSAFEVVDARWRIFRKILPRGKVADMSIRSRRTSGVFRESPVVRWMPERKPLVTETSTMRSREMLMRSYHTLLNAYAPSSILITFDLRVLTWFGAAAQCIDTMNNLAEWTVPEIVHPDLHFVINVGVEKLRMGHDTVEPKRVTVNTSGGVAKEFVVRVRALDTGSDEALILVMIEEDAEVTEARDITPPASELTGPVPDDVAVLTQRTQSLERDLRLTEETLQHVTERLEASGEELQASNEELQASNEELQASNEELQSSNEELHAVNEELVSVSAEHERKIELLSELNDHTEVVLRLMNAAVMVLDAENQIRRFSGLIEREFLLQEHDVDRSISIVGPRLDFVEIGALADKMRETGQVQTAKGEHQGRTLEVEARSIALGPLGERQQGALLVFRWTV